MTLINHSFQFNAMVYTKIFLSVYLFLSSSLIWAETTKEKNVRAPVERLHSALINIMKNSETHNFEKRYTQLQGVIEQNFNLALISKVILSRYWKSLDKEAQNNFIELFKRLTISTYVSRFNSFTDESFQYIETEPMKKGRYLVKTTLTYTGGDPVSLNYIVQEDDNHWKIISVIANGVNDLSLKRREYSAVTKTQGFDALKKNIKQKIKALKK